ncbi:MAG: hypothetical protein DI535_04230 [Citrobacter freundii]|nr:MAG: hypothetical protein DI535_04230 [Citrobacter freundii]
MILRQKYIAFLIAILLMLQWMPLVSNAQDSSISRFGHSFLFNMNTTEKTNMVRQPVYIAIPDTAVYTIFDKISTSKEDVTATTPMSAAMLGVKLNPDLTHFHSAVVSSISQQYYSFLIQDSSDAILVAMGINDSNYRDYRYHVVQNDSVELVPWSPVTDLRKDYGAKKPFGFIGRFNYPGKWIIVEVYNVKNYAIREGVVFDWRSNLKPQLEQIIFAVPGNYFNLAYPSLNHGYATQFNKQTGVPEDFRFPSDSVRYITFQLRNEESRVYSVHLIRHIADRTDTLSLGMVDNHGYFSIDHENFARPGKYELVYQRQQKIPDWNESQLLRIPFETVKPATNTALIKRLFLGLGITLFALLISFWVYRRATRRMIKRLAQQKETAQLKLKSVQSQLNPHFIFNALSSIQHLMNQQATNEANHYLTKFASLTRAALDSSDKEMISLEDEWQIAANYLQMEQLRFGFSYELLMDHTLQPTNIEVPPMLLQPLIENAVKHGIAGKKDGMIRLMARQTGKNLQLVIEDNGRGFDPAVPADGFGLRLSRERIGLLNSLYPSNPFIMDLETSGSGTQITITLNNWL